MIPLTGLFGLLAPLAPVPFSHMRFQPRRMRSGWTDRTHTPLSAAITSADYDAILRATIKRERKGAARLARMGGAR